MQARNEENRLKALRRLGEKKEREAAEREREKSRREKERAEKEEKRRNEVDAVEARRSQVYTANAVMVLQEQGHWRVFVESQAS